MAAVIFAASDIGRATGFVRSASGDLPECVDAGESSMLRNLIDNLKEAIEDLESAITECDINDIEAGLVAGEVR